MTNSQRFSVLNKRYVQECLTCGNKEDVVEARPCSKCMDSEHTVRITTRDKSFVQLCHWKGIANK